MRFSDTILNILGEFLSNKGILSETLCYGTHDLYVPGLRGYKAIISVYDGSIVIGPPDVYIPYADPELFEKVIVALRELGVASR